MEQVVQFPNVDRDTLSLEEQLVQVLKSAQAAVAVDRLHLWAFAQERDRLLYVAGSGLSEDDVVRILQKGAYDQNELLAEVRGLLTASIGRRGGNHA